MNSASKKDVKLRKELTVSDKIKLINQYDAKNVTQRELARTYGISIGCVNKIIKNRVDIQRQFQRAPENNSTQTPWKIAKIDDKIYEWLV